MPKICSEHKNNCNKNQATLFSASWILQPAEARLTQHHWTLSPSQSREHGERIAKGNPFFFCDSMALKALTIDRLSPSLHGLLGNATLYHMCYKNLPHLAHQSGNRKAGDPTSCVLHAPSHVLRHIPAPSAPFALICSRASLWCPAWILAPPSFLVSASIGSTQLAKLLAWPSREKQYQPRRDPGRLGPKSRRS